MATDPRTIETLSDLIADAGEINIKKMFGEYGVYCDGRFIGVVCDDQFHLKPTKQGRAFAPELEMLPAYDGASPSMVVPAERLEEHDWIIELVQITARHVPAPKKRGKAKG